MTPIDAYLPLPWFSVSRFATFHSLLTPFVTGQQPAWPRNIHDPTPKYQYRLMQLCAQHMALAVTKAA